MYIPLKPLVSFKIFVLIFSESKFSKVYTGFKSNSLIIVFNLSGLEVSIFLYSAEEKEGIVL